MQSEARHEEQLYQRQAAMEAAKAETQAVREELHAARGRIERLQDLAVRGRGPVCKPPYIGCAQLGLLHERDAWASAMHCTGLHASPVRCPPPWASRS